MGHILPFYWMLKSEKALSFKGASPPDPLTRGSAPGPHWGLRPQTPVIGSRYRARHLYLSRPTSFRRLFFVLPLIALGLHDTSSNLLVSYPEHFYDLDTSDISYNQFKRSPKTSWTLKSRRIVTICLNCASRNVITYLLLTCVDKNLLTCRFNCNGLLLASGELKAS